MDRVAVAKLWREIAQEEPPPILAASGLLYDESHHRLPQPGFVGERYEPGGLLIMGLNPASGGDGLSKGDLKQYDLLRNLQTSEDVSLIAHFEAFTSHLADFMPAWNIIRNNGVTDILKARRMSFDDVAYLNVCKWRTKDKPPTDRILGESWIQTRKQVELLDPREVIILGIRTCNWVKKRSDLNIEPVCIRRMRGDHRLHPDAIEIVERLKHPHS